MSDSVKSYPSRKNGEKMKTPEAYRDGNTVVIDIPNIAIPMYLDMPVIVDTLEELMLPGERLNTFSLLPGEKLRLTYRIDVLHDEDIVDDMKEPHRVPGV